MKHLPTILTCLLAMSPLASRAAGFDCAKAGTWVERAICDDRGLSALDERMASAYHAALEAAGGKNSASGQDSVAKQKAWLKQRNQCTNTTCLHQIYEQRLETLTSQRIQGAAASELAVSEGRITDSGPRYSVIATYPVFRDLSMEPVNRTIRAFVQTLTAPFVSEYQSSLAEDEPLDEMPPWSLEIEYDPPYVTGRYLLVAFTGYDYRGGAHGMPILEPLVIARADGRRIPPEGLFKPDSRWVETLSTYCLDELRQNEFLGHDPDWLRTGTAPEADNYRLLYPGPEGLTVVFPPYAVAPYAAGPQSVLVPYARLADILNPELFPR